MSTHARYHDAAAPARRLPDAAPRSVGVVTNLRSRRNLARTGVPRIVSPGVIETSPVSLTELREALAVFARRRIELLVIDGGDGTVRDVLTAAIDIFGASMPDIAVVPSGKTNALAIDLGVPDDWTVARAMEAAAVGRAIEKSAIEVTRAGQASPSHRGFLLGVGGFVRATELAQRTHGWGAFNGVAVGLSLGLALTQTLFGGRENAWQRGERLQLRLDDGAAYDQRFYLALTSTLEQLPLGLAPFGPPRAGLKLLTIDAPPRRMIASVVPLLQGADDPVLAKRGYRRFDTPAFDLALDGEFVLDGEVYPGGMLRIITGAPLRFIVP